MKKLIYRFACLTSIVAIAAAFLTVACKKDETTNPNEKVIDPDTKPADLKQMIKDANANLRKEKQWGYTQTKTQDGVTTKYEYFYNADNQKLLETEYENNALVGFEFVDNDKEYRYNKYQNDYDYTTQTYTKTEVNTKELMRPTTNAAKFFMYTSDFISGIDETGSSYTFSFKLSGNNIVVTRTPSSSYSSSDTTTYEVTLLEGNKYNLVKRTSISYNGGSSSTREVRNREYTFSYSGTNPSMPSGFKTSDFEDQTANYKSAKVMWGEGKGENTFWASSSYASLYCDEITRYAPDVAGKTIKSFTANGQTYNVSSSSSGSIPVTEGMTITAVWQ